MATRERHLSESSDIADVQLAGEGTWFRRDAFEHAGRDLVARFGHYVEDSAWWVAVSARVYGQPLESVVPEGWRAPRRPRLSNAA